MSRFLKLLSILAIVALIAVPAFAEVQNVKVSGDIDSKAIRRAQYDFSNGNSNGNPQTSNTYADKDTWFTTTARVQIDADLTDNVSTCVRLLNEREWGTEAPVGNTAGDTTIALDLASVKMKEMFYAPLTLTIGRQNIRLGSGLVMGDPDTNDMAVSSPVAGDLSARKAFDAVRATLDYNPLTVDLILAKIDANTIARATTAAGSRVKDDVDLYAINAAYKFNQLNSELEGYIISRIDQSQGAAAVPLKDQVNVYGIRGSLEPASKFIMDGELAIQTGSYADATFGRRVDREAWAADIGAQLATDIKWSPKFAARYSFRSGQKSPGSDADADVSVGRNTLEYEAWDTMFEDQTHGIIANKIFSNNNDGVDSNGHTFNVMASVVPLQDLTVAIDYYHYLLAEKWYSDNSPGSTLSNRLMDNNATSYEVKNKKELGDEIDLSLVYDYTEDVKLGLTAVLFLPGSTFQKNNDNAASTVMADVSVSF